MGIYDLELDNLKTRRARAQALRDMSYEALPTVHGGGRIAAPVSWTERLAKLAQTGVANAQDKKIDQQAKDLEARRQQDMQDWLGQMGATQNDELATGVQNTATGMLSGDPTADAARIQAMTQGQNTLNAANEAGAANQRAKIQAMALKGIEMGGVPSAIGSGILQQQFASNQPEDFTVGPGEKRYHNGKLIAEGGTKETPEDKLLVDIVDKTNPAGYSTIKRNEWEALGRPQLFHKPQAVSNVNLPPEETAEAKEVGKGYGEMYNGIQTAGLQSTTKLAKLDRMDSLLKQIDRTGKYTGTLTDLKSIGSTFGIDLSDQTDAEIAFRALGSELALGLRNPAGGAGMPGALSDKDREFLMGMAPGLEQTKGGNKLIIDTARQLAKRDREVAQFARDYRKAHGRIDEGFQTELQAWADEHPMFPEAAPEAAPPAGATRPPLTSFGQP